MTLPSSGTITLLQIYNEAQISASSSWYNRGANLGAYRGVSWWKDNTETGTFPSGTIAMSDFYAKRSNTPVTPGSTVRGGSGGFTVPLYSTLTVVVRGGGGGGGGGSGNIRSGGPGGGGGSSSFGGYASAGGGGGGAAGGAGGAGAAGAGSDGTPGGGGGGGGGVGGIDGNPGGAGGKSVRTMTNPISGGDGPSVGSSVYITVGGGGSGGTNGQSYNGLVAVNLGSGAPGGGGYVEIYWS